MTPHCCLAHQSAVALAKARLVAYRETIGRPYDSQRDDGDLPENQKKRLQQLTTAFDEARDKFNDHLRTNHGK